MKNRVNRYAASILFLFLFCSACGSPGSGPGTGPATAKIQTQIYAFTSLTGGEAGALDAISGVMLNDKDMALGVANGEECSYYLDADSGIDEFIPVVIAPREKAGRKRWIKTGLKYVTPEMFWTGGTDYGAAIRAASVAIADGGILAFFPGKTYPIYGVGETYTNLGTWVGKTGIYILGNGATLTQDPKRVYSASNGTMWLFRGCNFVKVDGFNVTGPILDITSSVVKGNDFVRIQDGTKNVDMPNNRLQGVIGGLLANPTALTEANRCKNIHIGVLKVVGSFYGVTGQSVDSLTVDELWTDTVHRSFFFYNSKQLKANIYSKDAYAWDVLLTASQGLSVEDVEINYRRDELTTKSYDGGVSACIRACGLSPVRFSNIKLNLNIRYNATGETGAGAVRFVKTLADEGTPDTLDRGHTFENITISGAIDGMPHYTSAEGLIETYSLCIWGPGDYFRNVALRDLVITNNTGHIYFAREPFVTPLTLENVYYPGGKIDAFSSRLNNVEAANN